MPLWLHVPKHFHACFRVQHNRYVSIRFLREAGCTDGKPEAIHRDQPYRALSRFLRNIFEVGIKPLYSLFQGHFFGVNIGWWDLRAADFWDGHGSDFYGFLHCLLLSHFPRSVGSCAHTSAEDHKHD